MMSCCVTDDDRTCCARQISTLDLSITRAAIRHPPDSIECPLGLRDPLAVVIPYAMLVSTPQEAPQRRTLLASAKACVPEVVRGRCKSQDQRPRFTPYTPATTPRPSSSSQDILGLQVQCVCGAIQAFDWVKRSGPQHDTPPHYSPLQLRSTLRCRTLDDALLSRWLSCFELESSLCELALRFVDEQLGWALRPFEAFAAR